MEARRGVWAGRSAGGVWGVVGDFVTCTAHRAICMHRFEDLAIRFGLSGLVGLGFAV